MQFRNLFITLIFIIISLLGGCDKNSHLAVHIIDVGQGDSILIQTPNSKNILVDSGDENSSHIIKSYLKKYKIKTLDIMIATHPDSDHIGSLDNIVNDFNVKSIFMPEQETDTKAYKNLVNACSSKNLPIKHLYKGDIINVEDNIDILTLSPSFIQDDNNLNSIVFKLDFVDKSFLFTGDSEYQNEMDIINSFNLYDVDFLKVGHHGSSSSTNENFLKEISPDIATISCGYKNQYGHPHQSTLENLSKEDIKVYRTDLLGDIVFL
ncbi:ComEC/Rec2 family competence protein [[Clostridium] dakarense]|uniref:ComEC/Rec2 family competence protein n=1 Tax=Faecalimicrobium dakarense TaxID=1301100 RepID=UPI0004B4D212|nr:ComEC/Rec2 family competence protein [[Clostridium] dakarense]